MRDESELLEQFRQGDAGAFRQLATRNVDWMYSTARRRLTTPHLAEDVTQAALIVLAKKKPQIRRGSTLSGWLFSVVLLLCKEANRREWTRDRHEKEAALLRPQPIDPSPSEMFSQDGAELVPHLDEAVARLKAADQRAIVLRFYEKRTLAEIGALTGVSEDAARKRVDRAVDKLRAALGGRGPAGSASGLAAGLTAYTVLSAPPSLAASVGSAAAAGSATSLALAKKAIVAMTITKYATAAATVAVLLLLTGISYLTYSAMSASKPNAVASHAEPRSPPAPPPAAPRPLKVGVIISLRTATETGWIGKPYGFNVQTRIINDLRASDFELHPVVEPSTANDARMKPIYAKFFADRTPIRADDAAALRSLDVLVANEVWETTPELLEGVTAAVERDGVPLLNSGGIGTVKPQLNMPETPPPPVTRGRTLEQIFGLSPSTLPTTRSVVTNETATEPNAPQARPAISKPSARAAGLAGLVEGQYAWNAQAVECEVVADHPLLGSLSGRTDTIMLECNGVYGVLPKNATPLIRIVNPADVHATGEFTKTNPAYTFCPLYVSSLGQGTVVGYHIAPWKPVPAVLQRSSPGGFHASAVRWLATQTRR